MRQKKSYVDSDRTMGEVKPGTQAKLLRHHQWGREGRVSERRELGNVWLLLMK